jgi:uncharacterized membrane protein YraQ (UPF0718 family)
MRRWLCAGYFVEILFSAINLVPEQREAMVLHDGMSWNYTTWLDIAILILAAAVVIRFLRTSGVPMLRTIGGSPDANHAGHGHHRGGHAKNGE